MDSLYFATSLRGDMKILPDVVTKALTDDSVRETAIIDAADTKNEVPTTNDLVDLSHLPPPPIPPPVESTKPPPLPAKTRSKSAHSRGARVRFEDGK